MFHLKRIKTIRLLTAFIFCGILLTAFPQKNHAYDNDTHFWLTYYLAVKAGYTKKQATQIASANISVDLDPDTDPVLAQVNRISEAIRPLSHLQEVRRLLHALPRRKEVFKLAKQPKHYWWEPKKIDNSEIQAVADRLVAERKAEFWNEVVKDKQNPGVFLHYLQDSYAHRGFLSYIGHAGYSYVDFLDTDCAKGEQMAQDTLRHLIAFREKKNPENIVLESSLGETNLAEITATVKQFCAANPNPLPEKSIEPNDLLTVWQNEVSDKKKKTYHRRLPAEFIPVLARLPETNPFTDSCKAREIVKENLDLSEDELPDIWQYNLNKKGKVENDTTYVVLRYGDPKPGKGCYFSRNVKAEKPLEQPTDKNTNNVPCLKFTLVGDDAEGKQSICVLTR